MSELRWPFILCYFAIKIEFFGLNRQQVNWSKKLHGYFSQNSKMAYLGRYEPLTNTDKNRKLIQPGRFWTLNPSHKEKPSPYPRPPRSPQFDHVWTTQVTLGTALLRRFKMADITSVNRRLLEIAICAILREQGFASASKIALETLTEMLQSCK